MLYRVKAKGNIFQKLEIKQGKINKAFSSKEMQIKTAMRYF